MSTTESKKIPAVIAAEARKKSPLTSLPLSNGIVRLLTGLVLVPLAGAGALFGGWLWAFLTGGMVVLCLLEYAALSGGARLRPAALTGCAAAVAAVVAAQVGQPTAAVLLLAVGAVLSALLETMRQRLRTGLAALFGVAYIGIPAVLVVLLREQPLGLLWAVVIFGITAGTDTFAYLGGRITGRTKLAPVISPGKTVEGAVIGLIGGSVISALFLNAGGLLNASTVLIPLIAPLIATGGDLFESAIKRYFRVKDSHIDGIDIMPGHGGVLDRADSLLAVIPFVYLLLLAAGYLQF